MALDSLRYGVFKPQWVGADPKALPGFGGEVASWPDYKFSVQALEKKEQALSDTEKKKLGPLGLSLVAQRCKSRSQGTVVRAGEHSGLPH